MEFAEWNRRRLDSAAVDGVVRFLGNSPGSWWIEGSGMSGLGNLELGGTVSGSAGSFLVT